MDNLSMTNSDSIQDELSQLEKTKQWQRLSPIAIVYFGFSFIQFLLGQIIFIAPAILIGYKHIVENPLIWLPVALGVIALLMVSAFLSFYYFQYRLSTDTIEIKSGVFKKKHINLPFSRIQNVKLEEPIYYRITGYACLQLDTAGSNKQEAKVVALPLAFAQALKQEILSQHKLEDAIEGSESDNLEINENTQAFESLLNTRSLGDLVIHGMTSNRIWLFLGISAPFFDEMAQYIGDALLSMGFDIASLFNLQTHSWLEVGLYALTLTMLVMLILTLFSVLGSVLTFYGYTLTKTEDKYIRRSGLLTKHEVTMRLSRLQMIIRKQDWLDLALKRINLKFEQSNAQMQNYNPGAVNNKIIVPSIKPHECQALIDDVYPDNQLSSINFKPISKYFLLKHFGYILMPLFILVETLFIIDGKYVAATSAIVPFALLAFLIFMRWFRWGFAMDNHYLYVRKGVVGVDYLCFPVYKVQQTQFKQSILMKKRKLANVKLVVASGAVTVPFIEEKSAYELIDSTLFQVESTARSWM